MLTYAFGTDTNEKPIIYLQKKLNSWVHKWYKLAKHDDAMGTEFSYYCK